MSENNQTKEQLVEEIEGYYLKYLEIETLLKIIELIKEDLYSEHYTI
jgi:hypothetical protein